MSSPISVAKQFEVLRSRADPATWSLGRLGRLGRLGWPAEWRDKNRPGNRERCREAVDRLFTLTRAELEAELAARALQPSDLGYVHLAEGLRDGQHCLFRGEADRFLLNVWRPVWLDRLCLPCRTSDGSEITRFL